MDSGDGWEVEVESSGESDTVEDNDDVNDIRSQSSEEEVVVVAENVHRGKEAEGIVGLYSDQINDRNRSDVDGDCNGVGNGNEAWNENDSGGNSNGNASAMDAEVIELKVGMLFNSRYEIHEIYQRFGKYKGFGINRASTKRDKEGKARFVTYACHKEGKPRVKNCNRDKQRSTMKVNCKARVCASRQKDGKWRINSLVMQHNHTLNPENSRFLHQHMHLTARAMAMLKSNYDAGIQLSKSYRGMVLNAGGYHNVGFTERDCRNHMLKLRKLQLEKGDADAVIDMFTRMSSRDRNFFFKLKQDKEGRMKNVIWVDGRSKLAYQEFGDVVSFDTTYLVNKYKMPFAPFVGINHHGQSIILGCALISIEKATTFEWIFKAWLECMGGVAPKGIITDQCAAKEKAIKEVFRDTNHRWCLWHIMSQVPLKLKSKKHKNNKAMKEYFKRVVYESTEIEEFECGWATLLEVYDLADNEWLMEMYEVREKWVPVYVNNHFWGGMASTQSSESMNAFFDGYINYRTTLKQFVDQYEVAMMFKIEKECMADYNSKEKVIATHTRFRIEKQFQEVYTNKIFSLVSREVADIVYCNILKHMVSLDGNMHKYEIEFTSFNKKGDPYLKYYNTSFAKAEFEVKCNCRKFESSGILCSHILQVLKHQGVHEVPSKLILNRWRKDVRRCYSDIEVYLFNDRHTEEQVRRKEFDELCTTASNLACSNHEMFVEACKAIRGLVSKLQSWQGVVSAVGGNGRNTARGDDVVERDVVKDPILAKPRGRPKRKRLESLAEKVGKKRAT